MHHINYISLLLWGIVLTAPISGGELIDEIEYSKMPKLFTLDDFRDCLLYPVGLYCVVDIELKSTKSSDLWYQIKNFSENSLKHYRHDILHKGLCVSKRYNISKDVFFEMKFDTKALSDLLSKHIDEELQELHGLNGNVNIRYCKHKESEKKDIDNSDWAYLAIVLGILIMNITGTIYHVISKNIGTNKENKYLISLSIISNWRKLMSPTSMDENSEKQKKQSLRGIQGIRFLTMVGVIFSHVLLIISYGYVDNTQRVETPYDDPLMHLVYNGSLIVQTFFIMSSFLMAYNFLIYVEKKPIKNFWTYFLIIFQRWLRLTPVYALVIGFLCTIYEKLGSGPLWQYVIGDDADSCKRWWWTNILYVNNYVGDGQVCLAVTWYLATDTQLFCYGIMSMMVMWKFPSITRLFLGFLLAIAVLIPGILTYKNGYYPAVPQGPEEFRTLYENNPTFKYIYTTIAGNIGGYTVGLIGGCIHYYTEKNSSKFTENKWFKLWYYLTFPLGLALIFSGAIFYENDYVYNPLTAALYASLYKIAFSIIITSFILGVIYKCDNIMRGMVEWSGYQVAGRLTYCAYLIHTIPQRYIVGVLKQPYDLIDYNVICMFISSITLTYFISVGLCVFVEIPMNNIQKNIFQFGEKNNVKEKNEEDNKDGANKTSNNEPVRHDMIEIDIELNKINDCSRL